MEFIKEHTILSKLRDMSDITTNRTFEDIDYKLQKTRAQELDAKIPGMVSKKSHVSKEALF